MPGMIGPFTQQMDPAYYAVKERFKVVRGHLHEAFTEVARLHDEQAHITLGYRTWEACARAELNISRSRSYQLLNAGRTLEALLASTNVDVRTVAEELSEGQMRKLTPGKVGTALAERVVAEIARRGGASAVTAADIEEIRDEHLAEDDLRAARLEDRALFVKLLRRIEAGGMTYETLRPVRKNHDNPASWMSEEVWLSAVQDFEVKTARVAEALAVLRSEAAGAPRPHTFRILGVA